MNEIKKILENGRWQEITPKIRSYGKVFIHTFYLYIIQKIITT